MTQDDTITSLISSGDAERWYGEVKVRLTAIRATDGSLFTYSISTE
jgi:hypothetical protein